MDVQIHFAGQESGTIPYTSLPSFRLLCEQNGFQTQWDAADRRLYLDPSLKGTKIFLAASRSPDSRPTTTHAVEWELLTHARGFLSDSGADIVLLRDQSLIPEQGDLYIQFTIMKIPGISAPQIAFFHDRSQENKKLIHFLKQELEDVGIQCVLKKHKRIDFPIPFLAMQCRLPESDEQMLSNVSGESIALGLASGILRYFQTLRRISPLSCLPLGLLQAFFGGSSTSHEKAIASKQEPDNDIRQEMIQVKETNRPQEASL